MKYADRYKRQIVLPEIGLDGQQKLLDSKILCIGAGGLGSPALLYLAAAGVGHIGIADFDTVDESNLQRQVLFSTEAVGKSKADQAKKRLLELNPTLKIKTYKQGLNAETAADLFPLYDLILDGTDNFQTKFLINDAAVKFGKKWIYGAIQGFDGQASVFDAENGPCYRCLYPAPPKAQIQNCAEAGVIGAVAGMVGMTQAMQAIQLISGHDSFEPLLGKLWLIDMRTMGTQTLAMSKNPTCPICSQTDKSGIQLKFVPQSCRLVPEFTSDQLSDHADALLIDVRETPELTQGQIGSPMHCPLSALTNGDLPELPKDKELILYCQGGVRSVQAGRILQEAGYDNVFSLKGGFAAWLQN